MWARNSSSMSSSTVSRATSARTRASKMLIHFIAYFPADPTALRRAGSCSLLEESRTQHPDGYHGLAPWRLMLTTRRVTHPKSRWIPRPCAVEAHAHCYESHSPQNPDGYHGLAPW